MAARLVAGGPDGLRGPVHPADCCPQRAKPPRGGAATVSSLNCEKGNPSMRESTALLLEGGSLRCLFTAGVLDTFLDAEMIFPTVAGVSAGSLSGINYVAGQKGRTLLSMTYTNYNQTLK